MFLKNLTNLAKFTGKHLCQSLFFIKVAGNFFASNFIDPFQDGGRQKDPSTNFSPVTFTNVGITLKNFLTFTFNSFGTLVQNFKAIPGANPKLLNLNQDHPSKKVNFLVKCLQNRGYDNF